MKKIFLLTLLAFNVFYGASAQDTLRHRTPYLQYPAEFTYPDSLPAKTETTFLNVICTK